jgi:hypothetical protein
MDSINDKNHINYIFLCSHGLSILISLIVMRKSILMPATILCQFVLFIMYFNNLDEFVTLPKIKFTLSFLLFIFNLIIVLQWAGQNILFQLSIVIYKLIVTGIMAVFLFMTENQKSATFNITISLLIMSIAVLIIYTWFVYGINNDSIFDIMNIDYNTLKHDRNIKILCLVTLLICCNFLI